MKRFVSALFALALALPFEGRAEFAGALSATATAPSAPASVRASTETPDSARLDDARSTELVAQRSRSAPQGIRPGGPSALPGDAGAFPDAFVSHARTSGLDATPVVARELAIPFDATAPPVGQLN